MADLSEQLRGLLADPAAMEKIASIAGSLSAGGSTSPPAPSAEPAWTPKPAVLPSVPQKRDPRAELLRALRPFVSREKQERLDEILKLLTIADLILPLLRGKGGKSIV